MDALGNLKKLIDGPRDGPLLRFSIGNELLKAGHPEEAITHLRDAVARDPAYSAAWKLLGRALAGAGQPADALAAYRAGIAVADAHGDIQAAKEMKVFARRMEKALAG
jgi:predicted Zn-dependent protease